MAPCNNPNFDEVLDNMSEVDMKELIRTIYRTLDGQEWDSETASTIADIYDDAGFVIHEPEDF